MMNPWPRLSWPGQFWLALLGSLTGTTFQVNNFADGFLKKKDAWLVPGRSKIDLGWKRRSYCDHWTGRRRDNHRHLTEKNNTSKRWSVDPVFSSASESVCAPPPDSPSSFTPFFPSIAAFRRLPQLLLLLLLLSVAALSFLFRLLLLLPLLFLFLLHLLLLMLDWRQRERERERRAHRRRRRRRFFFRRSISFLLESKREKKKFRPRQEIVSDSSSRATVGLFIGLLGDHHFHMLTAIPLSGFFWFFGLSSPPPPPCTPPPPPPPPPLMLPPSLPLLSVLVLAVCGSWRSRRHRRRRQYRQVGSELKPDLTAATATSERSMTAARASASNKSATDRGERETGCVMCRCQRDPRAHLSRTAWPAWLVAPALFLFAWPVAVSKRNDERKPTGPSCRPPPAYLQLTCRWLHKRLGQLGRPPLRPLRCFFLFFFFAPSPSPFISVEPLPPGLFSSRDVYWTTGVRAIEHVATPSGPPFCSRLYLAPTAACGLPTGRTSATPNPRKIYIKQGAGGGRVEAPMI